MVTTATHTGSGDAPDLIPDDGWPHDERLLIGAVQMEALRFTLHHPVNYVQRIVEHLSFLSSGGQQWRRDVQIRIPMIGGLDPGKEYDFIVSLGMFRRRRLPDFEAFDSAGNALSLLTRFQHGHCLAESALAQYLLDPDWSHQVQSAAAATAQGTAGPSEAHLAANYQALYRALFELFTSVEREFDSPAADHLRALLSDLGAGSDDSEEAQALLADDLALLAEVTQYLCWVRAKPGGVVRLGATYTIPDAERLSDRGNDEDRSWPERLASHVSNLYTRIGLGPINYEMFTPANAHAGSYYFMVEPPAESKVGYLDWGIDNTASGTDKDWLCAHASAHVHNGTRLVDFEPIPDAADTAPSDQADSESLAPPVPLPGFAGTLATADKVDSGAEEAREEIEESRIFAYLRLDLSDHWQIAFGAGLNLVFVWLAESGALVSQLGGSTTPWLLFTPAALVAYVAQQSRHYYAATTGWVRIIIWGYLAMNLAFLVSISFDLTKKGSFLDRHGFRDDLASVGMATASIIVLILFAAMGRWHERFVRRWFRQACEDQGAGRLWRQRLEAGVRSWLMVHPRPGRARDRLVGFYRRRRGAEDVLGRLGRRAAKRWRRYTRTRRSVELYTRAARRWGNTVALIIISALAIFAILIVTGLAPDEGDHPAPKSSANGSHHELIDVR